ncbi:Lrp/AsnC family transcriptional regulator [Specibacter cremeus]|uniref:Lrp/AsnC family transcriptional regulator n=1 Tax=Specibacter cremeus TaxID=1629051 RepID=UPI000F796EBB|nr:AsnC family transcriptional regulator [Specibacter cremeus]
MNGTLNPLEQRIVAALQVDGRASWKRIADALHEPERNVIRYGTALLESGRIAVTALAVPDSAVLVRVQCAPGTVRVTTNALAQRRDCIFAYALTGSADCVAELVVSPDALPQLILDELPGTVGLVRFSADPVLSYPRTVNEWHPGILTEEERAAVGEPDAPHPDLDRAMSRPLDGADQTIVRELIADGRVSSASLARTAGISEPTARRRLAMLRSTRRIQLRLVVEPGLLGLPTEAMLWIKARPAQLPQLLDGILASPLVRYVATTTGEYQLVANLTAPNEAALYRTLTTAPWAEHVQALEVDMVLFAGKRSGRAKGANSWVV